MAKARTPKTETAAHVEGSPEPAVEVTPVAPAPVEEVQETAPAVEAPTPEPVVEVPTQPVAEVPPEPKMESPVEVKASSEPIFSVMAAPTLATTGSALAYTEGEAAKVIDSGITATDSDNTITTGYVEVTTGYDTGSDVLAVTNANGITGTWDAETGRLSLAGSTTPANWQALLRTVTFVTGADPDTTQRVITFMVNDGGGPITATRAINVTALEPTVSLSLLDSVVNEQGTTVRIAVTLDEANLNEDDVTVPLLFTGTAVKGTDYTVSAESVVIAAGDTEGYITVTATNDTLIESSETIIVTIGTVVNGTAHETDNVVTLTLESEDEASVPVTNFDNPEIVGHRRNGLRGTRNDSRTTNATVRTFLTTLSGAGGSMHSTNQTLQAPKQTKSSAIAARNAADKTITTQVRNNYRY
jgi:hypothetical protein